MAVLRIVPNLPARDPAALAAFYRALLGLETRMELAFIHTLGAGAGEGTGAGTGDGTGPLQLSLAREGGGGTPLPALSVEVDDLDAVLARARALGAAIVHGPVVEDWGVRRFFLRDPEGTLVNLLEHQPAAGP